MVVNVAADYWKAGQVGFQKGCTDLGIAGSNCTYFAPPNGKLTEQNSELETLRSQGITGYSISAIDPAVGGGHHRHRREARASSSCRSTRRCPAPPRPRLYLGTPNYTAGLPGRHGDEAGARRQGQGGDPGRLADRGQRHPAHRRASRTRSRARASRRAEGQRQPAGRHRDLGRRDHPGEQPGRQRPVRGVLLRRPGARPGGAVGRQDRHVSASSPTTPTRRRSASSSPA